MCPKTSKCRQLRELNQKNDLSVLDPHTRKGIGLNFEHNPPGITRKVPLPGFGNRKIYDRLCNKSPIGNLKMCSGNGRNWSTCFAIDN